MIFFSLLLFFSRMETVRAAEKAVAGLKRPAGRQFDMPGLSCRAWGGRVFTRWKRYGTGTKNAIAGAGGWQKCTKIYRAFLHWPARNRVGSVTILYRFRLVE